MLAEREGFEPSVPVTQDARLAIWCLRPLGHLSAGRSRDFDSSTAAAQVRYLAAFRKRSFYCGPIWSSRWMSSGSSSNSAESTSLARLQPRRM